MSSLTLVPAPVVVPVVAGPRPLAAPIAAETARALRPVDALARGDPLRNPSARERPVGPPPSFEVNVLEDLRERLLHAVEVVSGPAGDAVPATTRQVKDDSAQPGTPAVLATSDDTASAPPHLDKKV